MNGKAVSGIMLTLLIASILTLASNIPQVKAIETVYIRPDGSIDPPTAPILRDRDLYTLAGDIFSDTDGIVIERDNMTLDGGGYTLQGSGSGYGINLTGRSNLTIQNFQIRAFEYGIYLWESSGSEIFGNSITDTGQRGVYLSASSRINIASNNITDNHERAIKIVSSSKINVTSNNITNNWGGIELSEASNNSISDNYIANNHKHVAGIRMHQHSNNNSIFGNTFVNDGLIVSSSFRNEVEDNMVNGKPLIYLEGVSGHTVRNAGQVILVKCTNITVEHLSLSNTVVGVELCETRNSRIAGNKMANNSHGILLERSRDNSITGNTITDSVLGVHLQFSSDYNVIAGNSIANCDYYGLFIFFCKSDLVYHNNFVDNAIQVKAAKSGDVHTWDEDYPSGGNYWSDYDGDDMFSGPYQNETGSDGIGDNPYAIDDKSQDNYPLMEPWMPSGVSADLVRRQAWPEHHHYDISKDEDEYQTLFAKVKNLGNQTLWVKAVFKVTKDEALSTVIESEPALIETDTLTKLSADFGPLASADIGRHHVSATCWYSHDKAVWRQGEREKTFKFNIVL